MQSPLLGVEGLFVEEPLAFAEGEVRRPSGIGAVEVGQRGALRERRQMARLAAHLRERQEGSR